MADANSAGAAPDPGPQTVNEIADSFHEVWGVGLYSYVSEAGNVHPMQHQIAVILENNLLTEEAIQHCRLVV